MTTTITIFRNDSRPIECEINGKLLGRYLSEKVSIPTDLTNMIDDYTDPVFTIEKGIVYHISHITLYVYQGDINTIVYTISSTDLGRKPSIDYFTNELHNKQLLSVPYYMGNISISEHNLIYIFDRLKERYADWIILSVVPPRVDDPR